VEERRRAKPNHATLYRVLAVDVAQVLRRGIEQSSHIAGAVDFSRWVLVVWPEEAFCPNYLGQPHADACPRGSEWGERRPSCFGTLDERHASRKYESQDQSPVPLRSASCDEV
jgi:hypothetical protein